MQIFTKPDFNFIRWRWHAIALSLVVILAGAAAIWSKGLPLGVDFKGGSTVSTGSGLGPLGIPLKYRVASVLTCRGSTSPTIAMVRLLGE